LQRARFARRGLATRAPLDRTTHALLLRQLAMAHYERGEVERARELSLQGLELRVLVDVFHEDVARAALGAGDVDGAVAHLRMAARTGPASRRAFHHWTLGSVLFLAQRYGEAIAALTRAVRWATHDKPLFQAHLALARIAAGDAVDDLQETVDRLVAAPCGRGYGRFVLGHLAYASGTWDAADRFLRAFVERTEGAGPARMLALRGEIEMTRATLAKIAKR
jgi:tetratricopeptide (TPR) repeat protein